MTKGKIQLNKRTMLKRINHIQLAMPEGKEAKAREFFVEILGLIEVEKPHPLNTRGGCWFKSDETIIHVGVDKDFKPQ